jgi:putative ubiquitin-RnfH superfamily antitoxin RatB of RatAB toxin-antitoxin module
MHIEIIYAEKEKVFSKALQVTSGCKIIDAINQSGVLDEFPDIDLSVNKVGVFSQLKDLDAMVNDGERIEIYRPLVIDPKEARRKRAG